jgi:hypothetical protein
MYLLGPSLAAALLDSLFEHPACCLDLQASEIPTYPQNFLQPARVETVYHVRRGRILKWLLSVGILNLPAVHNRGKASAIRRSSPKVGVRSSEHFGLQSSDRLTSRAFPASLARLA